MLELYRLLSNFITSQISSFYQYQQKAKDHKVVPHYVILSIIHPGSKDFIGAYFK